jgi:hypothetical protein
MIEERSENLMHQPATDHPLYELNVNQHTVQLFHLDEGAPIHDPAGYIKTWAMQRSFNMFEQ